MSDIRTSRRNAQKIGDRPGNARIAFPGMKSERGVEPEGAAAENVEVVCARPIWGILSWLLAATLVVLSGCVSIPQQALAKDARAGLSRIAVLRTQEPAEMRVTNIGGVGGGFGLIGGAVEEAEENSKSSQFTQHMVAQNLKLGEELSNRLEAELRKAGYTVKLWTTESPRPADYDPADYSQADYSTLKSYADLRAEADAILDVWLSKVGYIALGKDYVPWIRANVRLVSTRDQSQLYFQAFSYGAEIKVDAVEHFSSDSKFAYGDFETLMAKSSEAADGIQAGIQPIVERIAQQLR